MPTAEARVVLDLAIEKLDERQEALQTFGLSGMDLTPTVRYCATLLGLPLARLRHAPPQLCASMSAIATGILRGVALLLGVEGDPLHPRRDLRGHHGLATASIAAPICSAEPASRHERQDGSARCSRRPVDFLSTRFTYRTAARAMRMATRTMSRTQPGGVEPARVNAITNTKPRGQAAAT